MSQKTLNLCLERYNFVKFGETTKSTHTVLCTNNAHSVNSDKYRLTPTAIASKHGEGYVFTLNYDFDRPLFTIVQTSYSIDGTSGKILFEGIDPISKGGSKYLRRVEVSPVKLSDGSYLLEVTKDEYLRIGTTGAALGDENLESLNEKIVTMGGIEKSVETVGGKQVLKLDASGSGGAKEIVYFDVDPSDPPSGIYEAIGEALSNNKLPAIRSDGKLYQYTSTDTDRYDFVGMFGHSDVGYEALTVWIGDAVNVNKLDASLGYTAVPARGTDESPAWAKVCELDLDSLLGYTSYGLALLFTSVSNNDGENVESGLFVADIGSNWHSNSNGCNASWMAYTPNSDEYSKILGIKLIGKYGVPSNPVLAPYPIYKVEVWVKYYGSNEILVNALQNARYNYSYGMNQGLYKFPEGHIATPQSTEPSYEDTEEYVYKDFFYTAESPSVSYTHVQSLSDSEKVLARDNIGAASASDVSALQSQVSSLSDVSAYSVKGEATVAQLNAGPSGIQAGWAYQLTDSGTLTDGTLAVVAGDTVAWDGTKWFPLVKSDYYATKTYAQNVAHSIAPEFVPNVTDAIAGMPYIYGGKLYVAKEDYNGDWDASKFYDTNLSDYFSFDKVIAPITFKGEGQTLVTKMVSARLAVGKTYKLFCPQTWSIDDNPNIYPYSIFRIEYVENGTSTTIIDKFLAAGSSYGGEVIVPSNYEFTLPSGASDVKISLRATSGTIVDVVLVDKEMYDRIFANKFISSVNMVGGGQTRSIVNLSDFIVAGRKYRIFGNSTWNVEANPNNYPYGIFQISYVKNGITSNVIDKQLAANSSYDGNPIVPSGTEFSIPSGATNIQLILRAVNNEKLGFVLIDSELYDSLDRYCDSENTFVATIPTAMVGTTYTYLRFSCVGEKNNKYKFVVTSNDDDPTTNANKMHLRVHKVADGTYVTLITSSAASWEYEGLIDFDFDFVDIRFERVNYAYTYNISMQRNGILGRVSSIEAKVENLEKSATTELNIAGNDNTLVKTDLTGYLLEGKDYLLRLHDIVWSVAQNDKPYLVYAFRLYYRTSDNVITEIASATIAAGESAFTEHLEWFYNVKVENGNSLILEIRALSGTTLKFTIEENIVNKIGILDMYPAAEVLPKIGMLKKKTPFSGVGAQANTPLVLLWFSDIHGDIENVKRIVEFRNYYSIYIDDILNTGDSVPDNLTNYDNYYAPMLAAGADKILVAIGNHDVTHANVSFKGWAGLDTISSIYDKFVGAMDVSGVVRTSGKNYYYKDYSGASSCKNIRLIVLDSCIQSASLEASGSGVSPTDTLTYMASQLSWLEGVLSDAVTNNKAVVIATHDVRVENEVSSTSGFTALRNLSFDVTANMPQDILDAVDTFIGNGGEFVCWLAGHRHEDHITKVQGHSSQMVIHVNTASSLPYKNSASSLYRTGFNGKQPITRATDAFDVIGFDTYNKLVKIVRIGCNVDSYGRPINMVAIDYANGKIVSSIDDV